MAIRWLYMIIVCCAVMPAGWAQEPSGSYLEQQLENHAEAFETASEDDATLQHWANLRKHPLNLNEADEFSLQALSVLSALQIQSFFNYRRLAGKLLSIFELQAIPGWDLETIYRLLPLVTVGPAETVRENLQRRFKAGDKTLLLRWGQTLRRPAGYFPRDTLPPAYTGNPQGILMRYRYAYKQQLQYGFTAEKDAGEAFFKGAQKAGFDFYSVHLFARNLGSIRQLALGDFTVNFGQGLLIYQSLAFRKSTDVLNIKRQAETFRPYNSAGEANFMRGAACTWVSGNWQFSVFASRQRVSANHVQDSLGRKSYLSSILTGGYHRTIGEIADRRNTWQTAGGLRLVYKKYGLQVGANAVYYQWSLPIQKSAEWYNRYAFSGNRLMGISGEYAYTWRNLHVFGEMAFNPGGAAAAVHGLLLSLHPKVDAALQYRNLPPEYHSYQANAFTESSSPVNENGTYIGITMRPVKAFRIDAYTDFYRSEWLRYRVNRPSEGREYVWQLTWKPDKQVECYTRFRHESKAINLPGVDEPVRLTENIPRNNWRTQVSCQITPAFSLRSRAELMWYDGRHGPAEKGFLWFADFFFKPPFSPVAVNCRWQYFETDSYNSRIYAYESDVLYSFSIPPVYGTGNRAYFNLRWEPSSNLQCWLRMDQTRFSDRQETGTGHETLSGNRRTSVKIQVLMKI